MTARISLCLLFFLTCTCDCVPSGTSPRLVDDSDPNRYCRISTNHTMCLFLYDNEGGNCIDVENGELDKVEIAEILGLHDAYRDAVARGDEKRGNPGPQPAAKTMMEMIWDDELARLARRWVLQCNLFQRDQCRDVERFGVSQNVHVLDMDDVGNVTAAERIRFHIQSWYDEVEHFDSAEVGLVNFATRNHSSYVALVSATIIYVGCGRAIYTVDLNETGVYHPAGTAGRFRNRVEALVCNYGPVDRQTPQELYKIGAPGFCPAGTNRSTRYDSLCKKFQNWSSRREMHGGITARKEQKEKKTNDGALPTARAVYLGQLLLLLLSI